MIKTVEWTNEGVRMLDQRLLPTEEKYLMLRSYEEVAEAINNELAPIREKRKQYEENPALVDEIIARHTEKCRELAVATLKEVKEKMGLL